MFVFAPGRFSIMMGCFHFSLRWGATMRRSTSGAPPGLNGITMRTVLEGKPVGRAAPALIAGAMMPTSKAKANLRIEERILHPLIKRTGLNQDLCFRFGPTASNDF